MPECNHHVESKLHKDCTEIKKVEPTCTKKCTNSENYNDAKVKTAMSPHSPTCDTIKQELTTNGPVTMAFTVYADFET